MAKSSNGLHLPGSFNSYPKGPKPAHYAPHGQHPIHQPAKRGTPPRLTPQAARVTPGRKGGQPTITEGTPSAFSPRHDSIESTSFVYNERRNWAIRDDNFRDRPELSPRHDTIEAPTSSDTDPVGNYYFALEITENDNTWTVAHFRECSGLKSSTEVFEIFEGGLNGRTHRRPAQSKWENIVLKVAMSDSTFLTEWRDKFLQDNFEQRTKYSGSIAVMNNAGQVVRRFSFVNAWPLSWEGPSLNSGGSDLSVETLEIVHEGLTIDAQDLKGGDTA